MAVWTTSVDVTDRWVGQDAIPATDHQITTLLEDAEDSVLREFPDMQTRIDRAAGTDLSSGPAVPLARVKRVIARMVIRFLRNPEGHRSTQMGAGPYQQTVTFGGNEPGTPYLTDEDRAELGGASGGAFTIDATPPTAAGYPPPDATWTSGDTWTVLP